MSDEIKADEIKASIVYAIGIAPNPITKFDKLISTKVASGMFVPAIVAKAALPPDGYQEVEVTFPIFSFEAIGEKVFEDIRATFHKRLDKTFDEFKRRWYERQGKKAGVNENELAPKAQEGPGEDTAAPEA